MHRRKAFNPVHWSIHVKPVSLSRLRYPPGVKVHYKLDIVVKDPDGKVVKHVDCGQVANDYSIIYWLSLIAPLLSGSLPPGVAPLQATALTSGFISMTVAQGSTSTNILSSPTLTVNSYNFSNPNSASFQFTITGTVNSNCGSSCQPMYFTIGANATSTSGAPVMVGLSIAVNPPSNSCSLTLSTNQVVSFTLTGSASITTANASSSSFIMAWEEMWAEIVNAILGSSSPFNGKTFNWAGSGNAVTGYYIYVVDTNGNYQGTYTSSPASSSNITSPSLTGNINNALQITGGTLNLVFTLNATSNYTINLIKFGFELNGSTVSGAVTYTASTGELESDISSVNYSVTQGSAYSVSVTESESTTVTT